MQSNTISFAQAPGASMEMRREMRYRLDAQALFSWESAQHTRLQGEGVTRDISVFGAFIVTPTCPPHRCSGPGGSRSPISDWTKASHSSQRDGACIASRSQFDRRRGERIRCCEQ